MVVLGQQKPDTGIKWRGILIAISWTIILSVSLYWNISYSTTNSYKIAEDNLRQSIKKDLLFRSWAADHNGVYALVTEKTPPNPYLTHMPNQDIITEDGRHFTLMNPAYIMRQVYEKSIEQLGIYGRIVSEKPLNPNNLADEWETAALRSFSVPEDEIITKEYIDGKPTLRIIKPFFVEEGCIYCHEAQGFKLGDLRGGISTSIDLRTYIEHTGSTHTRLLAGYFIVWIVGLVGIAVATIQLEKATMFKISETRYRSIVENTNDAIIINDFNGIIVDLNERASALYGYERNELIGVNVNVIAYGNTPIDWGARVKKLKEVDSVIVEAIGKHKKGHKIPIEVSVKLVTEKDKGVIQSYIRDITDRKRIEAEMIDANAKLANAIIEAKELAIKADEANAAKSKFLSNMSHEIRTPMNAVIGMAEIIEELSCNAEQKKYIRILKRNGDYLLNLINNILDLAKMESGNMEVKLQTTLICNVLNEIALVYQPLAAKKDIEIKIITKDFQHSKCCIQTDEDKLRQILINLVGNAIKFTNSGSIELNIKTIDLDKIQIAVKDTGIGIAPNRLDEIFKAFKQGENSKDRTYSGTGLGLTISETLVELMNGRIWAESKLGFGSTFIIELPYMPPAECSPEICSCRECPITVNKSNSTKSCSHSCRLGVDNNADIMTDLGKSDDTNSLAVKTIRVLLAEDNIDNSFLFSAYLKKEDIELDIVDNGEKAVNKYIEVASDTSELQYSIIFMDIQMPILDGHQAVEKIREWERLNAKKPVPIYALTAYALVEEKQKSLDIGCNGHITKPVRKQQLIDIINSHRK